MVRPTIGVVIPSFNDWPFLERLFNSLYTTTAGASFWPLVIDDMSDDGTGAWIADNLSGFGSAIRLNEKAYFTRACNTGIKWHQQNTSPFFYFLLNSDTEVSDHWASALLATGKKMDAGIVGATLLNPDGTVQHLGGYGAGYHFQIDRPWVARHEDRLVPWVTGAAMLIAAPVIDMAGLLPAGNSGQYDASDREFCTLARLKGIEVAVSAGCVLTHYTHEARKMRNQ